MPCDTYYREQQTKLQREREIKEKLEKLERLMQMGREVQVVIGPTGAIMFKGWSKEDRAGITDACAYRKLTAKGSWALKQAIMKAETLSGKKVNPQVIAAGVHSHDGKNWSAH